MEDAQGVVLEPLGGPRGVEVVRAHGTSLLGLQCSIFVDNYCHFEGDF